MVFEHADEYGSQWEAMCSIAAKSNRWHWSRIVGKNQTAVPARAPPSVHGAEGQRGITHAFASNAFHRRVDQLLPALFACRRAFGVCRGGSHD